MAKSKSGSSHHQPESFIRFLQYSGPFDTKEQQTLLAITVLNNLLTVQPEHHLGTHWMVIKIGSLPSGKPCQPYQKTMV